MVADEASLAPPRPGPRAVRRDRVTAVLDDAARVPLTVLVAPAGTGKTSCLAAWAALATEHVVWLDARVSPDPAGLAAAWARTLDGPAPSVLVVDDAHALTAQGWDVLGQLLDRVPARVRIVLASREDVPLPLVALQLAGRVVVLRAATLRFDDAEASQLVRLHAPGADEAAVVTVCRAAQGWAALLVLGALALHVAPGAGGSTAELVRAGRPSLDHLRDEVLAPLPAATRCVLLSTCDEPVVTDDLAVVLSGDTDAPVRLRELAVASDGLVVRSTRAVGDRPVRWSLHPLVLAALRREVAADGPEHELARSAHVGAARHFRLRGQWTQALRHALADDTTLVRLLVDHGPEVLGTVTGAEAAAAVRALPRGADVRHPALLGTLAAERRMAGDLVGASSIADEAAAAARALVGPSPSAELDRVAAVTAVRGLPDEQLAQLTDAAALAAWQARLGLRSVGEALRSCRLVLAAFPTGSDGQDAGPAPPTWPLGPVRLACLLHELSSLEIWIGDLDRAQARVAEVLVTGQRLSARRLHTGALANRALLDLMAGEFQTGARNARASLALAARTGGPAAAVEARALVVLAWAGYWEAELPTAAVALQEVERRTTEHSDPLVTALADLLRACFEAESGDVLGARTRLAATAAATATAAPPYLRWTTGLVRGQLALVAGDLTDAVAQLEVMEASGWPEGTANLRAVMEAMSGQTEAALARFEDVVERRLPGLSGSAAAVAAADLTRLRLAQGDLTGAREALWRALTLAAPQRVVLPLVLGTHPQPQLVALLDEAVSAPSPHPFAQQVLRAFERYPRLGVDWRRLPPGPPALDDLQQRQPPVRDALEEARDDAQPDVALTSRELEVVVELAAGGSYSDIAQALFITENTVKTHLSSAYRKLGVTSRSAALRAARSRGLV